MDYCISLTKKGLNNHRTVTPKNGITHNKHQEFKAIIIIIKDNTSSSVEIIVKSIVPQAGVLV